MNSGDMGFFRPIRYYIFLVVFLFVIVSGIIGYVLGERVGENIASHQKQAGNLQQTITIMPTATITSSPSSYGVDAYGKIVYDNWKTYTDNIYQFSFQYPPDTKISSQNPDYYSGYDPTAGGKIPPALETKYIGGLTLSIYNKPSTHALHQDFPYIEPCGSQYGSKETNEEFTLNGITFLHRRSFHTDGDPVSNITYGERVDYCFLSGTGNLVVFRGANGTLSTLYTYSDEDFIMTLLPTVRIQE